MSAARLRAEVPPVVTSLVGMVVAVVSGIFGISAHGLAAGAGSAPPTSAQILAVLAVSAGVGAVTAALARDRSPVAVSALGLLAGQGLVHVALATGHTHGAATHAPGVGHHTADPAAVRAAMDSAAVADALWTPAMLGAHVAAVVVTLAVVAVLSGTLTWVAARVVPLLGAVHLVVVDRVRPALHTVVVPAGGHLLARGGTRAPPVGV